MHDDMITPVEPQETATSTATATAIDTAADDTVLADDLLVEDVSIDGMCGVY